MFTALLLGLALVGAGDDAEGEAKRSPPSPAASGRSAQPALAAHLGMEIDDLDYEVQRQKSALRVAKANLANTQRAAQRGLASQAELERVSADVRSLEARADEAAAFRALKLYQRDVLAGAAEPDEEKAHALVLDLLRKQEAMGQVDLDYQTYRLRQEDALLVRGSISQLERDGAQIDCDTARLHVALSRARQAQLELEHALPAEGKPADRAEQERLRVAYLRARVHYFEVGTTLARNRLAMARTQQRRNRLSQADVDLYRRAYDDAVAALAAERKRLEDPESPLPASLPRAG